MVLRPETIEQRLKELDEILQELVKYREIELEVLRREVGQRWILERGLIAAATIIFDVADHILAGHFGIYAETYEESLGMLRDKAVISEELYRDIKGLGGFRNILVHRYLDINPDEVFESFQKGLVVFPAFAREILAWMDETLSSAV
ncbi:MAG: hypothetical protein Kow0063_32490 [Anaerolineae bacterium]